MNKFYKRLKNIKIREPRGTILILDRGFDMIAPVIHDYYYESLMYEYENVGQEGELKVNNRTAFLND